MNTPSILKAKVPGWGADLDSKNRPGVPREKNSESVTDLRADREYDLVPRQRSSVEVLVSSEHLRMLGRDVDYLVFDDEGHDVLKLANRVRCYDTIVGFFDQHLS
jgi:hypothetical protein